MNEWPPYPCSGTEPVYEDIELLDADGVPYNVIVASACYADWYCSAFGGTWRHYVPPAPAEAPDDTPA